MITERDREEKTWTTPIGNSSNNNHGYVYFDRPMLLRPMASFVLNRSGTTTMERGGARNGEGDGGGGG